MKRGLQAGIALLSLTLCGCTQTGLTKPQRSAVEQLLISTAADQALERVDWSVIRGKKVFVDSSFYESTDDDYVVGTIRDHVSINGGLLMKRAEEAELVLEARSGALSIDASSTVIGLPAGAAPIPFVGAVSLPEIAIYKAEKQYSTAKIALLIYERESREHVASTGPLVGRANIKYYKFLGYVGYTKTTIPEKDPKKKSE